MVHGAPMTPRTILALTVLLVLQATGAEAYDGRWLVVENLDTQTCYRVMALPGALPEGKNWQRLGVFNTFREAAMWTWGHRGGVCKFSPLFR
jgi:hypothetical protein